MLPACTPRGVLLPTHPSPVPRVVSTRGARGSERAFGWSGSCRPPPSHSSTQVGPALHVVKPGNALTGRVVRIGGCSQPSAVCIPASNKRLAPIVHTAAVRPWGISATVGRLCSAVLVQRIPRIRRGPRSQGAQSAGAMKGSGTEQLRTCSPSQAVACERTLGGGGVAHAHTHAHRKKHLQQN